MVAENLVVFFVLVYDIVDIPYISLIVIKTTYVSSNIYPHELINMLSFNICGYFLFFTKATRRTMLIPMGIFYFIAIYILEACCDLLNC